MFTLSNNENNEKFFHLDIKKANATSGAAGLKSRVQRVFVGRCVVLEKKFQLRISIITILMR